jgi:hypothetical protein
MKEKANVFICSKPLQYFNLTNIEKPYNHPNILIIENDFKDAMLFFRRVQEYDKNWDKVFFIKNGWVDLLLLLTRFKIESLFYHLDCYLYPAVFLNFISFKKLFIYEEGYGTYRTDIFSSLSFSKKKIRKFLNIPNRPGLHKKTSGVYVYAQNFYKKVNGKNLEEKCLMTFKQPFIEMLNTNLELSRLLFPLDDNLIYNLKSKRVGFYLTSWEIDFQFLESVDSSEYDIFYVKLHPHIKKLSRRLLSLKKINLIHSSVLAEFLLQHLVCNKNEVDVFHDNSSALVYFEEISGRFNIKNIGVKSIGFNEVIQGIKNDS